MQPLTEEERQKLVARLRKHAKYHESLPAFTGGLMLAASDEIDRLAAEVNRLRQEHQDANTKLRREWARSTARQLVDNQGRG